MLLFLFFLFMISGKISVVNMVFIWEGWFSFSDITVEIYGREGRVGYGAISVNSIPKNTCSRQYFFHSDASTINLDLCFS